MLHTQTLGRFSAARCMFQERAGKHANRTKAGPLAGGMAGGHGPARIAEEGDEEEEEEKEEEQQQQEEGRSVTGSLLRQRNSCKPSHGACSKNHAFFSCSRKP